MAYDITNKINSLFSGEFIHDKDILLSPYKKSKKKKKFKEQSSNVLTKVEKTFELNKEDNKSIGKNKVKKSSRVKKKLHKYSNEIKRKDTNNININNNKKIRELRTTVILNLKNIDMKKKGKEKDKYSCIENSCIYDEHKNKNKENVKKNNSTLYLRGKRSKEIKYNENYNLRDSNYHYNNNKKEKRKKSSKDDKKKEREITINRNIKTNGNVHNKYPQDSISITDYDNANDKYYDNDSDNDSDNANDYNNDYEDDNINNKSIKKRKRKSKIKYEHSYYKKTKKDEDSIDIKNFQKDANYTNNKNKNMKNNLKNESKENTLIYFTSEKESDIKSMKKSINSKSTKYLKYKNLNELNGKGENNSIIKVKRANNKKKLGEISSDFQISQKVNNLFIYSQRENVVTNENKNVICPGNIISFEYNVSQRKLNNTTRIGENNNNIVEEKINNINKLNKNELLRNNEMQNENNKNTESINNSQNNNNNKIKKIKNKCFCCL